MNYIQNKNILKIVFLLFLVNVPVIIFAQREEEEEIRPIDRIFFGGNFGMQFGTITSIEVSPIVGYYITPKLSAGAGIRFEYFKDKGYYATYAYETTIYGGDIFTRYIIISNLGEGLNLGLNTGIFIQAEYEALSLEKMYFDPPYTEPGRFIVHSVLVGGGIIQPIGSRSAFLLSVLYNLNESARSPYSNPIIRVGFTF